MGSKENGRTEYYFDYTLLFVVLLLVTFGIIMVYSSSSYEASMNKSINYDQYYFLKHQLMAAGLGLVAMFGAYHVPYRFWISNKMFVYGIYLGSLGLIVMVLTPLGVTVNGARRWLNLGISVQPAELAKVAVIIVLAYFIEWMGPQINTLKGMFWAMVVAAVPALMVLFITDNLSSAAIILAIGALMVFVANKNYLFFFGIAGAGIVALLGIIRYVDSHFTVGQNFRADRILSWLHPELYTDNESYQTLQALYAIGSGGWRGKGLGQSMQKLGFVPEAQNDMIFSIICEELGLIGAGVILFLFYILLFRFMFLAINAKDRFGGLLVTGVLAQIAVQVMFNVAVVTNVMPNTGISLPFISYGGTSLSILLAEVGLVMSVGRGIQMTDY